MSGTENGLHLSHHGGDGIGRCQFFLDQVITMKPIICNRRERRPFCGAPVIVTVRQTEIPRVDDDQIVGVGVPGNLRGQQVTIGLPPPQHPAYADGVAIERSDRYGQHSNPRHRMHSRHNGVTTDHRETQPRNIIPNLGGQPGQFEKHPKASQAEHQGNAAKQRQIRLVADLLLSCPPKCPADAKNRSQDHHAHPHTEKIAGKVGKMTPGDGQTGAGLAHDPPTLRLVHRIEHKAAGKAPQTNPTAKMPRALNCRRWRRHTTAPATQMASRKNAF